MAPPPFNKSNSIIAPGTTPLRMGGPPVDNVAIDEEGTVTLVRLVGYSILLGIVLSYICFRSLKITMMVFVVGGSSAGLSMGIVWWTSGRVDAILMSMPSLVVFLVSPVRFTSSITIGMRCELVESVEQQGEPLGTHCYLVH